ncbi:hypothetical protein Rhopal_000525-T1 [Rhodotorula paludigena]|uniref:MARVEL domain-containing protein n=1 Tax=Rhodotorula paludigena TaxID=86838 RepID=A0AAV5G521_9BASI|nr:hypothetical protein Rhopal_000525-T1 [Rhodotorula paludigena]
MRSKNTREAPNAAREAPPPYTLQRFSRNGQTRSNLRPVILIVAFFATIYGIILGAASLRRRGDDEPAKINSMNLIVAILYFVCVAAEVFGFFAAYRQSLALVRMYFYASLGVAAIVTGSELVRTIFHFSEKSSIISSCINSYSSDVSSGRLTSTTVEDYCNDSWRRQSYLDIALLVFSFFVAFLFASLAASYLHQLKNPQSMRTHAPALAPSSSYAYPLQPYPDGGPMPYPHSAHPYAAGPPGYPSGGPTLPQYDNPHGFAAPSDDKLPPPPPAAENPFADQVEHAAQQRGEPTRREGESAAEFELRQHEWDQEEQERRRREYGESTETVTLEPRR